MCSITHPLYHGGETGSCVVVCPMNFARPSVTSGVDCKMINQISMTTFLALTTHEWIVRLSGRLQALVKSTTLPYRHPNVSDMELRMLSTKSEEVKTLLRAATQFHISSCLHQWSCWRHTMTSRVATDQTAIKNPAPIVTKRVPWVQFSEIKKKRNCLRRACSTDHLCPGSPFGFFADRTNGRDSLLQL